MPSILLKNQLIKNEIIDISFLKYITFILIILFLCLICHKLKILLGKHLNKKYKKTDEILLQSVTFNV